MKPGPAQIARLLVWRELTLAISEVLRQLDEDQISNEAWRELFKTGAMYAIRCEMERRKLGVRF